MVNGGKVLCPLCSSATSAKGYSSALGDRSGITPVLSSTGAYHYSVSMMRTCNNKAVCGCTFFDHDALEQLPKGLRLNLLYSPEMATGEIFIGKTLETEIALGMGKSLGAKTIADMMNVKSATKYDEGLEAYLEHGELWWQYVVANVNDER